MATISDGTRVFSATAGTAALASEQNNYQDAMITLMNARWYWIPFANWRTTAGTVTGGLGGLTSAVNSSEAVFNIHVYENMKITATKGIISGATGKTAGSLVLERWDESTNTTNTYAIASGATWDTGGDTYANRTTVTGAAPAGTAQTSATGDTWQIRCNFGSDAATFSGTLWAVGIQLNFGQ